MQRPIEFSQPYCPTNFCKGTCIFLCAHVTMTRTLLLAGGKKTSTLQSHWYNPRQGTSAWIRARSKWRHFKLTGPRPAWLPFKEFRSMQTLGIYKGPDVLLPRRNQLRILSREFTCGRDKPRHCKRLDSRNFRCFYTRNVRDKKPKSQLRDSLVSR